MDEKQLFEIERTLEHRALRAELFTCFEKYFTEDDIDFLIEAKSIIDKLKEEYYPLSRG
jgi:hypothetical protein